MENLDLETLTKGEMNSIKGAGEEEGRWILIDGEWFWVESYSLAPADE